MVRSSTHQLRLDIKAPPPLFRCPISLEVMRSPVSLSTGVTYDRSSIQRWFDTGNTTCPATMLPLPSTDLVPNLTLRRLINLWSSSSPHQFNHLLLQDQQSTPTSDPLTLLNNLSSFLSDPDADPAAKNRVAAAAGFSAAVASALKNQDAVLAGIGVVALLLDADCIEQESKKAVVSAIRADLDDCLPCVVSVLKDDKIESQFKKDCLNVLARVLRSVDSGLDLEREAELLMPEMISVISGGEAATEGLGCVMELLHCKRAVKAIIESGTVEALVDIARSSNDVVAVERAIVVLEAVASCRSGRAAMMKGDVLEECVEGVVGRMMKVGKGGREAAVGLLWSLCFGSGGKGGDGRVKEVVAGAKGGMGKILVVMQGECSGTVKRMAGDLLRVFRVSDANSLIAGYNTRTTHIMPF